MVLKAQCSAQTHKIHPLIQLYAIGISGVAAVLTQCWTAIAAVLTTACWLAAAAAVVVTAAQPLHKS